MFLLKDNVEFLSTSLSHCLQFLNFVYDLTSMRPCQFTLNKAVGYWQASSRLNSILLLVRLLIKVSNCFATFALFQDGRIDYGEFVAMMQKGNAGVGRRTMRNSLNMSMRDVPAAL